MSADAVVGVTMTFTSEGVPDGITEVTRSDALAARLAFECALAVDDPVLLVNLLKEMDAIPDGSDPAVIQKAFITLLTSAVRPALKLLGPQAEPLRVMFRNCADEFNSMADMG